jgi:hypothetical protein
MFMGFVVSLLFRNYRMAAKPFSVKSPTTNTRWNRVANLHGGALSRSGFGSVRGCGV